MVLAGYESTGYETTGVMKQLVTNFTYRTANDF